MLDNLTAYAYATAFIFATLGFGYIFDRTYNQPEPEVSYDYYTSDELPNAQDLPVSDDAIGIPVMVLGDDIMVMDYEAFPE